LDTLVVRAGKECRIENNRRYTIRRPSGTFVGVLWHLSAAATIDVEEARFYSNGELDGGDLWIYALLMNLLCPFFRL